MIMKIEKGGGEGKMTTETDRQAMAAAYVTGYEDGLAGRPNDAKSYYWEGSYNEGYEHGEAKRLRGTDPY